MLSHTTTAYLITYVCSSSYKTTWEVLTKVFKSNFYKCSLGRKLNITPLFSKGYLITSKPPIYFFSTSLINTSLTAKITALVILLTFRKMVLNSSWLRKVRLNLKCFVHKSCIVYKKLLASLHFTFINISSLLKVILMIYLYSSLDQNFNL